MNAQNPESLGIRSETLSGSHDNRAGINSDLINVLQRAATLARKGKLSQAENILTPLTESKIPILEAMDLLAKIYAQQGKIDQAQALWVKALQMEPSNLHFLAALWLCAQYKKPRIQQFILRHSGLIVAICIWWLIVMFSVLYLYA